MTNITWHRGLTVSRDGLVTRYVRDPKSGDLVPVPEKDAGVIHTRLGSFR